MDQYFNYNIKDYTTFGIDSKVAEIASFDKIIELQIFVQSRPLTKEKHFVIGGGSNLLFLQDYDGLLLKPNMKFISVVEESADNIYIKAGSGVEWDDFVKFCTEKEYWGAENLSLIPGTVGASPVQNIGAYGVEVKDIIYEVRAINKNTGAIKVFTNQECQFAYRNSFFKSEPKQEWIVVEVTYQLSKKPIPNLSYGALKNAFSKNEVPSIEEIRNAVVEIRESKLPDPKEIGNAGSFFKNPIVELELKESLIKKYPRMPFYSASNNKIKLAAGWLIEQAGWKGFKEGAAGVHEKQALVLVNYGKAEGKDIYDLSDKIVQSVMKKFNVVLEREVIVVS